MLISLEWLKEYVDIKEDVKELENALTMIGQEVEAITVQGKNLDNVVIGQIVEYGKHPNAEKLTLTKVDIGEEEPLQIVCGAPNHRLGDKVIVSKVGAVLPGDIKITKSKIRGIESYGMICSEVELGIGNNSDGVVILPEDAPVGEEYRKYAKLNDVIFELEITPNRPDCLSHIGIAREIAAYYGRKVKYPSFDVFETLEDVANNVRIEIEDKERCKRFAGRVMRNVTVKESPEWLKRKIRAMGLNPVNNIVDATNFVMFEYNQPIHTYDLSKIKDMTIVVRAAKKGEKLVTLMGDELELDGELVIADSEKPMSIAGVMGGLDSGITNETKDIFIEVAYFTPENIRKTGKKLGITSESGYRNERGTDIENVPEVLDRVTSIIYEIAEGNIVGKAKDVYPVKFTKIEIPLDIKKFRRFMGKDIDAQEVARILTNLGLEMKSIGQETAVVIPPSYRQDLTRSADLYEEIIRMYGFENIENKMPVENIKAGIKAEPIRLMDESKEILSKIGLQEVINYSFIDKSVRDILHIEDEVIMIKNPIAETMSMMRPSLIYSILTNIRENLNRNQDSIKIFETSKVFKKADELAQEDIHVAIGICGRDHKTLWNSKPEAYDFYMLKGYVEEYMELVGAKRYKLERTSNPNFHPGRAADIKIGKIVVGTFGEIHPDLAEKMDITKERAYVAEINLTLLKQYISKKFKYERIVKYPEVTRDLAVVLDDSVLVGDMIDMLKKSSDFIETIELFDIYKGEHIEAGKKSVAISLTLRNKVGTLNEEDINKVIDKVLNIIRTKFAGEIRQ
ncbi:phenylalanine--tRNA ligase subunit beta [Fusobacterium perfoetens]|uniref:phenylalanine--tRNA ligase subunit beta n=1 Tax=Fusobacterium perfoetens TaxID=852 RepID=UPI00159F8D6B|nr:phenylalanine--tRNA ligase subunit beta [Fusobacterium perfoetens]MCF2626171.1 phenylalanine--tRNA ligase subunit beta [Fusobacterium perfoetens]